MNTNHTRIPADLVARKARDVESIEGHADPQLREIFWFIQWASWQHGGLEALARDIVATMGEHIGTPRMRATQVPKVYTVEDCVQICREIPDRFLPKEVFSRHWRILCPETEFIDHTGFGPRPFDWDPAGLIRDFNRDLCWRTCADSFIQEMPRRLEELCTVPGQSFRDSHGKLSERDWMVDSLRDTLTQYMERRARDIAQRVAFTEITKQVWEALDYALETRSLVHIDGDPRIGKTESIETRSLMYPGRFRMVKTPCSNSDGDFFKAIAIALGIDPRSTKLKDQVEDVCDWGGRH